MVGPLHVSLISTSHTSLGHQQTSEKIHSIFWFSLSTNNNEAHNNNNTWLYLQSSAFEMLEFFTLSAPASRVYWWAGKSEGNLKHLCFVRHLYSGVSWQQCSAATDPVHLFHLLSWKSSSTMHWDHPGKDWTHSLLPETIYNSIVFHCRLYSDWDSFHSKEQIRTNSSCPDSYKWVKLLKVGTECQ